VTDDVAFDRVGSGIEKNRVENVFFGVARLREEVSVDRDAHVPGLRVNEESAQSFAPRPRAAFFGIDRKSFEVPDPGN